MGEAMKKEIMDDLFTFKKSKDYYNKIGKAWKRGYLLYGPPGTGKSTLIAAMAGLLEYDIYDLELTAVESNTELRKLLIDTTSKSVIVIEDIDCSLNLARKRKDSDRKDPLGKIKKKKKKKEKKSKITLSGLLNAIDGLWSACGSERLFVFTTKYIDKLDPALIRRGRMDKHIEMSYCRYEAFKVLARNYLDLETHELFDKIGQLLEEVDMTPADVAENLMPKSSNEDEDTCLRNLINVLETAKTAKKKKEGAKETEAKEKSENKEAKEIQGKYDNKDVEHDDDSDDDSDDSD